MRLKEDRQYKEDKRGNEIEGQTIQWPKDEGQTIQWPKDEGQTIQWPKDEGQTVSMRRHDFVCLYNYEF
jgi:hypothetical protein